ncbi:MAG: hypothetical protein EOP69_00595 [Spirochaetia bacterium]|nr:MAG: hypothetical protein EOP69_00595 [Spirochaetia bacterium]
MRRPEHRRSASPPPFKNLNEHPRLNRPDKPAQTGNSLVLSSSQNPQKVGYLVPTVQRIVLMHRTRLLFSSLLFASLAAIQPALSAKFIYDQDLTGPGGTAVQPILLFMNAPDAELLGITGMIGDDWLAKGVAHTLRFLELAGHPDVPVYAGASEPLVNTPERMATWESVYGPISWKVPGTGMRKRLPISTPMSRRTSRRAIRRSPCKANRPWSS